MTGTAPTRLEPCTVEQPQRDERAANAWSRNAADERTGASLPRGRPHSFGLGLLCIDVGGCDEVGQRYGQAAMDDLLQAMTSRLGRSVRIRDTVSRHGAHELRCLLHDMDGERQVGNAAARLLAMLRQPCRIGHRTLQVHPSVGIAVSPTHGSHLDTLVEHASAAMRVAMLRSLGRGAGA